MFTSVWDSERCSCRLGNDPFLDHKDHSFSFARGIMSKGTACSDPKGVAASVCTRLVSPAGPDTAQSPARDPFNSFHLHVAGSDFNQGCTPDARDLNLVQLLL